MMIKIIWIAAPSKKKRLHVCEHMLVIPELEAVWTYFLTDRQRNLTLISFRDVWRRQLKKGER